MDEQLIRQLEGICTSIREAGFEPYDQLTGYLRTGNDRYITRNGNAREQIREIDRKSLKLYTAYLKSEK